MMGACLACAACVGVCGFVCGFLLPQPKKTHQIPTYIQPPRHADEFDLQEELYRSKASHLHRAVHRGSGTTVALKTYRKKKLSVLNRSDWD
jgi:hypothetical protein